MWPQLSDDDLQEAVAEGPTLADVLTAVVSGVHTEQEIADRFGTRPRLVRCWLDRLLLGDLLLMQWPFGTGEELFKPTKKGRARAAALASV
ncbi:hypothetical protein AB0J14_38315 [Micromonospora arborensis]|uniref:hypothetical protein n=1 Tax=Micromonospora arborensis TaxID=2116518 RepID=UPI0034009DA8